MDFFAVYNTGRQFPFDAFAQFRFYIYLLLKGLFLFEETSYVYFMSSRSCLAFFKNILGKHKNNKVNQFATDSNKYLEFEHKFTYGNKSQIFFSLGSRKNGKNHQKSGDCTKISEKIKEVPVLEIK